MRALWLALLLIAGCETVRPCRPLTLLVTVTLDETSAAATTIDLDVLLDGTLSKANSFGHLPGDLRGTIEIDFPSGYPAGHAVGLMARANANGTTLGAGATNLVLPDGCANVQVDVLGGP